MDVNQVQSLVDTIIVNGGKVTGYAAKDGPSVSASAEDPDGYRFKLLQRGPTPERICQLMLHVTDIGRAIKFYEMVH
jgi:lactoylglutathione lyase